MCCFITIKLGIGILLQVGYIYCTRLYSWDYSLNQAHIYEWYKIVYMTGWMD